MIAAPTTGQLFALVLAFRLFGSVSAILDGSFSPRPELVEAAVTGFLVFAATSLGYLGGAVASDRVSNLLGPRGYGQAMLRLVTGELAAVLGLVYAFLQLSALQA